MKTYNNLIGLRFNNLTVIKQHNIKSRNGSYQWVCKCICGNKTIVVGSALKANAIKSCGCSKKGKPRKKQHGLIHTHLYYTWANMKQRCLYYKFRGYHNYGGRGISICDEWLKFIPFKDWAYKNGYKDTLTLDRINNNGNYEPNNCRWVDTVTQIRNRRNTLSFTYGGNTLTLAEWANKYNLSWSVLYQRIYIYKWSIRKALLSRSPKPN